MNAADHARVWHKRSIDTMKAVHRADSGGGDRTALICLKELEAFAHYTAQAYEAEANKELRGSTGNESVVYSPPDDPSELLRGR